MWRYLDGVHVGEPVKSLVWKVWVTLPSLYIAVGEGANVPFVVFSTFDWQVSQKLWWLFDSLLASYLYNWLAK